MRLLRFVCWLALPVGLLIGGSGGAGAQVSDEARQACTPDAMRLCSEFVPDVARVTSCMMRKRAELSAACITAMRVPATKAHRASSRRVRRVVRVRRNPKHS